MKYRSFGATDLCVSERGFGAWAIGGASYGRVDPGDALRALSRSEELGCNFVDTAAVYGTSESLLGQFLPDRRHRWLVASKYSGQPPDMTTCLEQQLRRLRTDRVDFYQLHWTPTSDQQGLYDELDALKRAGKIRYAGVSLYSAAEIDEVIDLPVIDGIQVRFGLLDPDPLLRRLAALGRRRLAVVVRSVLKDGFLTGKYSDARDVPGSIGSAPQMVGAARCRHGAASGGVWLRRRRGGVDGRRCNRVSALVSGSVHRDSLDKELAQSEENFGAAVPSQLSAEMLRRIDRTQRAVGVNPVSRPFRLWRRAKRILTRSPWRA